MNIYKEIKNQKFISQKNKQNKGFNMVLQFTIEDLDLQVALTTGAEAAGMEVNEFAKTMLFYSYNTSQAMLGVQQMATFLEGTLLQKLTEIQINSYALRHQVTNLHADLLGEHEQRALDIAVEANELASEAAVN